MDKPRPMNCKDPLTRFLAYSDRSGDCWLWLGCENGNTDGRGGYARFIAHGKVVQVSHWAYEHFVGPIPEGLVLDHLCRNRMCVNPKHLEPVTQTENVLRGTSIIAQNAAKTHCKRGHEFTPENTRPHSKKYPHRRCCIACAKARIYV